MELVQFKLIAFH